MTLQPFELDIVLRDFLWQSSALLVLGLAAAAIAGRAWPARAHGILLAALVAAVAAPMLTVLSRLMGWGFLAPLELGAAADGASPPLDQWGRGEHADFAFGLPHLLALAWAAASIFLLARLATSTVSAVRLVVAAAPAPAPVLALARQIADRLGWSACPEVCVSDGVQTPVIWCWGRSPRILLPAQGPQQVTERLDDELRDVICHELAHLERRDHVSALTATLAVCLMPWNPLVWLAARQARDLSERACDAWVLAAGAAPAAYAQALLGLASRPQARVGLAAVSTRRGLGGRIFWILESGGAPTQPGNLFKLALAIAGAFAVSLTALAHHRPAEAIPSGAAVEEVAAPPGADGLVFVPDELDLGVVEPGASGRGTIWLVNAGDTPRRVIEAKPECGCTVLAGFEPTDVAPGGSFSLEIEMVAPTTAGTAKTKHVRFTIDGQPQMRVPVHIATRPDTQ